MSCDGVGICSFMDVSHVVKVLHRFLRARRLGLSWNGHTGRVTWLHAASYSTQTGRTDTDSLSTIGCTQLIGARRLGRIWKEWAGAVTLVRCAEPQMDTNEHEIPCQ